MGSAWSGSGVSQVQLTVTVADSLLENAPKAPTGTAESSRAVAVYPQCLATSSTRQPIKAHCTSCLLDPLGSSRISREMFFNVDIISGVDVLVILLTSMLAAVPAGCYAHCQLTQYHMFVSVYL